MFTPYFITFSYWVLLLFVIVLFQGHGHWVNVLALNTDYVMRTGAFEPSKAQLVHEDQKLSEEDFKKESLKRFNKVMSYVQDEFMVSGSDDFKLLLWNPSKEKKSLGVCGLSNNNMSIVS